jgi:endonuclease YncB( thermonuclease family)
MFNEFTDHPQKIVYPYNTYRAKCVEVYDGDTYTMVIDLGFYTYTSIRVRVKSIDTPEIRTKDLVEKQAGIAARDRVKELILGKHCVLVTDKDVTSFDRWIAEVYYFGENDSVINLGEQLINEGHADPYTK